jgi:hypothetical protein
LAPCWLPAQPKLFDLMGKTLTTAAEARRIA